MKYPIPTEDEEPTAMTQISVKVPPDELKELRKVTPKGVTLSDIVRAALQDATAFYRIHKEKEYLKIKPKTKTKKRKRK